MRASEGARTIDTTFDAWCEWLKSSHKVALLCRHGTFFQDVESLLKSRGVETFAFHETEEDAGRLARQAAWLKEEGMAPFALTINFYPPLQAALAPDVPYAAWIVDCTLNVRVHDPQFAGPNVHLFVFDERDIGRFTTSGFPNVHFMPQSANDERMRKMDLTEDQRNRYGADVAFVGDALILDCNEYRNLFVPRIENLIAVEPDPLTRRAFRITILSCEETLAWFDEHPFALVDEITGRLKLKESEYRSELVKLGVGDFEHLAIMVAKEAARRQRHAFIRSLSGIGVGVWGGEDWLHVMSGRNRYRGKAEHWEALPLVYNAAKINLNITRPYSDRGLPMRVFDVLASGGFLLTNHPHSVSRWFKPGRDVETYESVEELGEKIRYYLSHDRERREIAESGRAAAIAAHTHKHRLSYIFSKLFPDSPMSGERP